MTTTYTNTRRPVLVRWLVYVSVTLCILCLSLWFIYHEMFSIMFFPFYILLYFSGMMGDCKLHTLTVDEEDGIIYYGNLFYRHDKKRNPMRIADIATIRCKRSWIGYYRIVIHDHGVRFSDIYTTKHNAVHIRRHIKSLNPEVRYL